ncbi:hypothetical protein niasHT_004309 [Heterodera trifolii]|uniref:Uncharacterized protein n=1 Tax=Heterodera trifolii TaxID=157864 RepID=A0ABD2LR50_9BILA
MNVSPLMLKNADFLRHFRSKYRSKSSQRQMIENALDEQLLCFVEMCFNVLKGRVPLGKRQIQRLGELKHQLRSLARARCAKTARRVLLLNHHRHHHHHQRQTGAGFPMVASMLASVLLPVLMDNFLQKKKTTN